ncbi:hypothetical protein [Xanthomonas sp. GPE 39]|uniref:hypothetical protein n=1 Tax=Xanthomonas sp. GPE 39 TaxID=1583099 RepID=UPI000AA8A5AE|nr:hypothetical protein [Xanthomonas sp. GPE 39]
MKSRNSTETDHDPPCLAVRIDVDNAQSAVIAGLLAEAIQYAVSSKCTFVRSRG